MRKTTIICAAIIMFLAVSGTAIGDLVQSGGWAEVVYTIPLPGSPTEYQHTHAEAGFDIATGTPISEDDDYGMPSSNSYASTSHSYGESKADTDSDYMYAENYASADASVLESWGYGSTVYRVDFTLDMAQSIDIGYYFDGFIWVDSDSTAGSGFSTALLSIEINDVLVYDSDPEWDDFVTVTGIGYDEMYLSDSGVISYAFDAGSHQIAFFVDTYENAAVPIPGAVLLGILGLGVTGWKLRKFA